jgi:hypothetical protein
MPPVRVSHASQALQLGKDEGLCFQNGSDHGVRFHLSAITGKSHSPFHGIIQGSASKEEEEKRENTVL